MKGQQQLESEMQILKNYRMKGKFVFLKLLRKTMDTHATSKDDCIKIVEDMIVDIRMRIEEK